MCKKITRSVLLVLEVCILSILISACVYTTHSNAELLVRVTPQYPIHSLVEGWVKLSFDIDSLGRIENIKIVDANPKGVFERSARKALKKWIYKPATENRTAINQKNNEVTLFFKLDS